MLYLINQYQHMEYILKVILFEQLERQNIF